MTRNAVANVQAALVLAGSLASWVFVPHAVLLPVTLALLAVAVGGLFAARAYLRRLHEVASFLEANRRAFEPRMLSALLTGFERRLLRLDAPGDAGRAIGAVRDRLASVTRIGLSCGMVAIGAGLVAIIACTE